MFETGGRMLRLLIQTLLREEALYNATYYCRHPWVCSVYLRHVQDGNLAEDPPLSLFMRRIRCFDLQQAPRFGLGVLEEGT